MGTEDLNARVARNLRRMRIALGISQEAFPDRCGLHRTYVGAIERGERNVTLQTLERIAEGLNVDARVLLEEQRQ